MTTKKVLLLSLTVMLGLFLVVSTSGAFTKMADYSEYTPGTGINGTVHDLSSANAANFGGVGYDGGDGLDRICIFCHAPHHAYRLSTDPLVGTAATAPADFTYLPLWNHGLTTYVGAFEPYNNGAGPTSGPKAAQSDESTPSTAFVAIGNVSLLCLSCHDGSVAVNVYGQSPQDSRSIGSGGTFINAFSEEYMIGKNGDLSNHHPIGFDYDDVQAVDSEIEDADVAVFDASAAMLGGRVSTVREHLNAAADGEQNMFECSTCHAVHNTGNVGEKLLYVTDAQSNFCLICHIKGGIGTIR